MTVCARCHRKLSNPVEVGGITLGPKCAVKVGAAVTATRRRVRVRAVPKVARAVDDPRQMDWLQEAAWA